MSTTESEGRRAKAIAEMETVVAAFRAEAASEPQRGAALRVLEPILEKAKAGFGLSLVDLIEVALLGDTPMAQLHRLTMAVIVGGGPSDEPVTAALRAKIYVLLDQRLPEDQRVVADLLRMTDRVLVAVPSTERIARLERVIDRGISDYLQSPTDVKALALGWLWRKADQERALQRTDKVTVGRPDMDYVTFREEWAKAEKHDRTMQRMKAGAGAPFSGPRAKVEPVAEAVGGKVESDKPPPDGPDEGRVEERSKDRRRMALGMAAVAMSGCSAAIIVDAAATFDRFLAGEGP